MSDRWIQVKLPDPPPLKSKNTPSISSIFVWLRSEEYIEKIDGWIEEQWKAGSFGRWIKIRRDVYGFEREEDAAAFKLKWL